jgi:isoleucyl-tRNA synthetase
MTKKRDWKSTLNLPRTAFPMKAELPLAEPRQLAAWDAERLYDRILESRAGRPLYMLHDGPPYPTGNIHLGTALNKILKDMVVRSKTLAGFRAPYVPGWDCHGLPIETQVEKELGGKKDTVPPAEFRRMCREFAARYVDIHRRDFKRLGVFGRWDDPYLTMSHQLEARIAEAFLDFYEKGYVYRGLKPVYWCLFNRTALAEAEVEYEDHESPSIWVKYQPTPEAEKKLGAGVAALIWTTTPWTLPASRALTFHPDFDYTVVTTAAGDLLVAAECVRLLESVAGLKPGATRGSWRGRELEGLKFRHPFLDLELPAILGDHVTLEQGSGIVHTAPGHGAEDFYVGQKYGLAPYAPLDDDGRFTEGLPEYKGMTVFEANAPIVELLRKRGALVAHATIRHSYPHCWRCHNPVIFRATEQWFINLEHRGLRARALEEIAKVKWTPGWGEERIHSMIATRPDWCISRQRVWGVPITVFRCAECGAAMENIAAMRNVIAWFEREGADAWYSRPAEELLPPGVKCKCGAMRWQKESDILDVWFESGSTHLAVLDPAKNEWPADMYLEGPDQYRGWFHSSLLVAIGTRDRAPYRHVLTHGWTLDEQGRPMSKSLGNVILPSEICERWGADLLRVWVASQDYTADVRMSERVMTQLSEAYRKLRNTFRFALGNLYDFDPARDALPAAEMQELDRWMLYRAARLAEDCRRFYDAFEFHRIFHALHDFAVVDLSAFYFDILKDRLYTSAAAGPARRSAQTAVWRIAHALVRLAAPLIVFTAEEIWRLLPKAAGDAASVHLAMFPAAEEMESGLADETLAARERLAAVRSEVLKALEPVRQSKVINSNLEARVVLSAEGELAALLERYAAELPALFIVSQVAFGPATGAAYRSESLPGFSVAVERARGTKCERCWNWSERVGESADYPTLCERCVPVVAAIDSVTAQ